MRQILRGRNSAMFMCTLFIFKGESIIRIELYFIMIKGTTQENIQFLNL